MHESKTDKLANPPINELALSVQLEAPKGFLTPHLGLLWAALRTEFPRIEEHLPLTPISEALEGPVAQRIGFEVVSEVKPPRLWFIDSAQTFLVQAQPDRIGINWRRIPEAATYPKFGAVMGRLKEVVSVYNKFIESERLERAIPTHIEITYIDHVMPSEKSSYRLPGQIGGVLGVFESRWEGRGLRTPDAAGCFLTYPLEDAEISRGVLHFEAVPAVRRRDSARFLQLQTVARAALSVPEWPSAWRVMEVAHEQAKQLFFQITTREIRTEWGRLT